jgi:ShK domain-like
MNEHCPVSCRSDQAFKSYQKDCVDAHDRCAAWAELGECSSNTDMTRYCPKSCGKCLGDNGNKDNKHNGTKPASLSESESSSCADQHEQCPYWSSIGECDANPNYMLQKCAKSCGSCDKSDDTTASSSSRTLIETVDVVTRTKAFGELQIVSGNKKDATMDVVKKMLEYMESSSDFKSLPDKIQKECKNRNELCAFWAAIGEVGFQNEWHRVQLSLLLAVCVPHFFCSSLSVLKYGAV